MSETTTTNGTKGTTDSRPSQKKGGKSNALTLAQVYRLGKALETEQPYLNERAFSFAEAAEYLTEKLGFRVTTHNVESAALAAEIRWNKKRTTSGKHSAKALSIQRQSRHRTQMIHAIRMAVLHLYKELQTEPPAKLLEPLLVQNELYTVDEGKICLSSNNRTILLQKCFGHLDRELTQGAAPGSSPAEGA